MYNLSGTSRLIFCVMYVLWKRIFSQWLRTGFLSVILVIGSKNLLLLILAWAALVVEQHYQSITLSWLQKVDAGEKVSFECWEWNLESAMWLAKHGTGMWSSVEQAFVGRDEKRPPRKTPAWAASLQSKRDKNNCSKSSFVQTSSMNEDKIFHTGSMKKLVVETTIYEKWPKVQLPWSLSDQFSFSLAIFDWSPQKTLMLNVQPSNLSICAPAKIAWGWICWTVKTFCCVVVEVLTWFSSDWADVPGSRFRIADISRCRFRDAEW